MVLFIKVSKFVLFIKAEAFMKLFIKAEQMASILLPILYFLAIFCHRM